MTTPARIQKAVDAATEVADIRHAIEMLKNSLAEAEETLKIAYAKAGVDVAYTPAGEAVRIVASPTTSVDAEALKASVSARLWNQLRSDSIAMPKYHSARKMGRISDDIAAAVESINDRTLIRVIAAKDSPVTPAPKVVRPKSKAKAGSK